MQTKCQAAVDRQTKPTDLGCESTCRLPPSTGTPTVAIYYYCSVKTDTHFTTQEDRRPSSDRNGLPALSPSTNWVRRRVTTLIETSVLPLSHAATRHVSEKLLAASAVQAWQPCPLWEPSPSHPILL